MSIPLDNLYHYVEQTCQEIWKGRVVIYRFYPHGSKDLTNLETLHTKYSNQELIMFPRVFCLDQEPLAFKFYENATNLKQEQLAILEKYKLVKKNIRDYPVEIWTSAVLLHSEQNSLQVKFYQQSGFATAYYWSHAIIALDWFRFAQHVVQQKKVQKVFLIYNRAWSGTREYRLKFVESLLQWQLTDQCLTSFNVVDPDTNQHYTNHVFANARFRPTDSLENSFAPNTNSSDMSACFDVNDYEATDIEIVLETLFDDLRWHLTEKILRPIALGQPFILVGTPGSLDYLRGYGFKTFEGIWSESYDKIKDPVSRLKTIADTMKTIADWDPQTRSTKMTQAQTIADYNRKHFFSSAFFDTLLKELKNNLTLALQTLLDKQDTDAWLKAVSSDLFHDTKNFDGNPFKALSDLEIQTLIEQIKQNTHVISKLQI